MVSTSPAAPVSVFRHLPFLAYLGARGASEFAHQIAVVAVGWQIYALTGGAFYLGLVGLVQFLPTLLLVFFAGHAADRYDRKRVLQLCQFAEALTAVFLAWGSLGGWLAPAHIFAAVAVLGTATAFESPAAGALLPNVAPEGMLQKATALSSGAWQTAAISGPALGGFLYALSPAAPYTAVAFFWLLAVLLNGSIRLALPAEPKDPPTLSNVFAGVVFVRRNPAILGAISLDLFAVLFGGATALLPIYARDILHTGAWGLGLLRAAPAAGALLMTGLLARHTIETGLGMRMFTAVIVFGVATMVFAVSHWFWLSIAALVVMGAADTVSVVIRISLVQLATPDAMRGRVSAVNYLFVNASNQLGEFESGMTAALLGAMPAALFGGLGTIVVALAWMKLFPTLRRTQRA